MSARSNARPLRGIALLCFTVVLALFASSPAGAQEGENGAEIFAFEAESLNDGLPGDTPPLRLDTPRATMESFLDAIHRDELLEASYALNLEGVPSDEQVERGPDLALKLAFLLRRYDLIDWGNIPDQPDARVLPGAQQATAPYSRRSIELGETEHEGRPTSISLQRFRSDDGRALWLFSPSVVGRIDEMYAASRPGITSRWVPLRQRLDTLGQPSLAEWLAATVLLLLTCLVWLALYYVIRAATHRLPLNWYRTGKRLAVPFVTLVAAVAFRVGFEHFLLLTGPIASELDLGSEVVGLAAGAWLLLGVVSVGTRVLSQRYVVPLAPDDPENQRIKTTVYVIRRMALVVVALLSIGYILVRIGVFEDFGLSVLASAGAIGVLVAIAARPLLGNMVSGLQIALTDPVRIGDVLVYDGHWATVEDISFAHTVLRTWTDTRLIVPHTDFLSKSFENWSKEDEKVRRIVKVPVDYRIDVDRVRRKVEELVEGDVRSTGEPPTVEMVELDSETAVLWIWLSGTSAYTSWYLHNEVREKVVAFLKELDGGVYLPRRRHIVVGEYDDCSPIS